MHIRKYYKNQKKISKWYFHTFCHETTLNLTLFTLKPNKFISVKNNLLTKVLKNSIKKFQLHADEEWEQNPTNLLVLGSKLTDDRLSV